MTFSADQLSARRDAAVAAVAAQGLIADEDPVLGLLDEQTIRETVGMLHDAFDGVPAIPCVAAKAATLVPLLSYLSTLGIGCEVASPGELAMAKAAGFAPDAIVYDSPAKTVPEIRTALADGVAVNADNFEELARFDAVIAEELGGTPRGRVGMRINAQIGTGSIAAMSTATRTSKFGVGLKDEGARERIISAFVDRPWLNQLHVHNGSQGVPLELNAAGIAEIVDLAVEINERIGHQQITHIDVGGGLPTNFDSDEITPTYADYRAAVEAATPRLFSGEFTVITEFGRSMLAKSGTIVSRVEYVKETGERRIAIAHAGAQVATRTVFMPSSWPLRVGVYDGKGLPRTSEEIAHDVAGPCCFAGDLVAVDRPLPRIEAGDLVAVKDTGAYYLSTPFAYNALPRPAVYSFTVGESGEVEFSCIREAQTVEEVVAEAGSGTFLTSGL